jgi:hypothetical protein
MNNSEVVVRQKLLPALTKSLGTLIKSYLDEELGKGNYQWLWGDDDASLIDEETGRHTVLSYPCAMLVNPEISNYRLVQNLEPVARDIDRDALTAKLFKPSKPVKLEYELRILTNNPDNDESFMLALERASEEVFCIYPVITTAPDVATKVNIWWGQGRKYSYDTESTTRVYKITASALIHSRKFARVSLVNPEDSINLTTFALTDDTTTWTRTTQFETKVDDLVVYISEEFRGLPSSGVLEFDDWSSETVSYTGRRLNKLVLEKPLKHFHLRGTTLRIGVTDASN